MRIYGNGKKLFDGKEYDVTEISTIKDIINNTCFDYPDRVAYMYKTSHKDAFKELTFGDFKEMMDAMGTAMIHMGLKGAKIAVLGENSYRFALSYFTTVCGVGTIVPIDKNLQPEEIKHLLERADVELVFTDSKSLGKLRPMLDEVETLRYISVMQETAFHDDDERIVSQDDIIDKGRELLMNDDYSYLSAHVKPDDMATILFTSGTTGLAKGVMLSHRNFANNVMQMSKYFHGPKNSRVLSVLPMHHAYEMTCTCMTCFYQGMTIVICEGLRYLQSNFLEAKCNIMLGVPLVFENIHKKIFKQAEKAGQLERLKKGLEISRKWNVEENSKWITRKLFKSIQSVFGKNLYCLIVGGAAIDSQVIRDFKTMGLPIIQGYGMTESAPLIAINPDRYSTDSAAGIPIPGTEVKIYDADEFGIGEIICRSDSTMMGYYKDPETTAETIIDGWLHTGDYGYIDEDGWVYVTGRKKNVIVTKGGKNIFPEEIELYLLQHEEIKEVIVYGKDGLTDDTVCTAIIVPNMELLKEAGITTDADIYNKLKEIAEDANSKVPPYKRIKRIEVRENDFVKTTTLKIKRFEKENYEYKFDSASFGGVY
ncbi:MAG: AMP-binding protein [Firmicutes bacterium]|nr:AMP-binding protein [Bacillota bacterium]